MSAASEVKKWADLYERFCKAPCEVYSCPFCHEGVIETTLRPLGKGLVVSFKCSANSEHYTEMNNRVYST